MVLLLVYSWRRWMVRLNLYRNAGIPAVVRIAESKRAYRP